MPNNSNNSETHSIAQADESLESTLRVTPNAATSALDPHIALLLPKEQSVVLVCDVVESVRWMEHDEDHAIARWSQFASQVREQLAPAHEGRVVKSTGDGLMLEFEQPRQAAQMALALHKLASQGNASINTLSAPDQAMRLRVGLHMTKVHRDIHDLYGHGVNLAARIAGLAGAGETVVSVEVRDCLSEGLDGVLTDLGDCYVKHLDEPIRVYRLQAATAEQRIQTQQNQAPQSNEEMLRVMPAIAVIPFEVRSLSAQQAADSASLGDLIADGVIAQLTRSAQLRVVSRLSTQALRGRGMGVAEMAQRVKAHYLLSGSCVMQGSRLLVQAELVHCLDDSVVWSDRLQGDLMDLFELDSQLCQSLAQGAHQALLQIESQKAITKPLPNLQSYSLYLGGIQLIHNASPHSFSRGQAVIEHLVERHPRSAVAQTWSAAVRMLRTTRGMVSDLKKETTIALRHTQLALDVEPANSLALATEGIIICQLKDDPDTGYARLQEATAHDPNCSLGWLYLATVNSICNRTQEAVACAQKATALSPLDPHGYFYDALHGSALLFDGQSEQAAQVLQSSFRKNRYHATTVRTLIVALMETGQIEQARSLMPHLLSIEPALTAEKYLARLRSASAVRQRFAKALIEAGLPTS
jgi:adenylate cyclase